MSKFRRVSGHRYFYLARQKRLLIRRHWFFVAACQRCSVPSRLKSRLAFRGANPKLLAVVVCPGPLSQSVARIESVRDYPRRVLCHVAGKTICVKGIALVSLQTTTAERKSNGRKGGSLSSPSPFCRVELLRCESLSSYRVAFVVSLWA